MLKVYGFLPFLIIILFINTGYAQEEVNLLDELFTKYHRYEDFQGAVLVAEEGNIVYKNAFGLANREWNNLNQPDTKFDLASLSKQFLAVLILQLEQEGKIDLDSTLSTYYPEYRKDTGEKITIKQLLSHTSGIPNYTNIPYVWSDSLMNRYTKEDLVKKFCSMDLEFSPGSRYQYNNTGYFLLSMVVEKITGNSFEEELQKRIFTPLQMTHSGVDDRNKVLEKRAYGYTKNLDGYTNAPGVYMQNLQGAGNLYSTVDDLLKWDQALYTYRLVNKRSFQKMITPQTPPKTDWITPYANSYGFGVGLANVDPASKGGDSLEMQFHSGHISGFSSYMARFPERKILVIILSNLGGISTSRMNEIAQQAKNIIYGIPYEMPQRALAPVLYKVTREEGLEAAIKKYHYLVESFPYDYKSTEKELEKLAQDLMNTKQQEAAIRFLELNVFINPNWRTFNSLAEAFKKNNNPEEAMKYYKKSLGENPGKTDLEKLAREESRQAIKNLKKSL